MVNNESRKNTTSYSLPPTPGAQRSPQDREAVALQLGREPTMPFRVAARCPAGLPSVIENERHLSMPTSFWVTCPTLRAAISRVEASGGVRAAQGEIGAKEVDRIHAEHLARYGSRVAGVGEPGGRVKCLHAFTALHLTGAIPNLVAEWTIARLQNPYVDSARCPWCVRPPQEREGR